MSCPLPLLAKYHHQPTGSQIPPTPLLPPLTHLGPASDLYCSPQNQLWKSLAVLSLRSISIALSSLSFFPSAYRCFHPVFFHIQMLWELVLLGEPLVVMAPSPAESSDTVLALIRLALESWRKCCLMSVPDSLSLSLSLSRSRSLSRARSLSLSRSLALSLRFQQSLFLNAKH